MRLLPAVVLASIVSRAAFGQSYTMSSFAGGALPVNIPGTSASLGFTYELLADSRQPIATDTAGDRRASPRPVPTAHLSPNRAAQQIYWNGANPASTR